MIVYAHKKFKHTQEVDPSEATRIKILERAGWYVDEEATAERGANAEREADEGAFLNEKASGGLQPTRLPDDFPGILALRKARINTYAQLREFVAANELTDIKGIGDTTADEINAAIAD